MHINIECLVEACKRSGVSYKMIDQHGNVVCVETPYGKRYFAHSVVPLADAGAARICKDKGFSFDVLKDITNQPETLQYLDPNCNEDFREYLEMETPSDVLSDIESKLSYPLIMKRSRGYMGSNVFLCKNQEETKEAIAKIFDRGSYDYDYVALAQEYIKPRYEYRVIALMGEVELVYLKDTSEAEFVGNLSPLHYENAKAVQIIDKEKLAQIQQFIEPICETLDLPYGGIDLIEDEEGKLWLVEINSHPQYGIFIRDNGQELVVNLYQKILDLLASGPE